MTTERRHLTAPTWQTAWEFLSGFRSFRLLDLTPIRRLRGGDWLFEARVQRIP